MDQIQADIASARLYLEKSRGPAYVDDLTRWDRRVRRVARVLREEEVPLGPARFTSAERDRARQEVESSARRYSHTTNEMSDIDDRPKEDPNYLHTLSDRDLALAVVDGWWAGYHEHY